MRLGPALEGLKTLDPTALADGRVEMWPASSCGGRI
jgi:hypothetical protein